jgi:ribose transport system substrate-binding protein
MLQTKRLRVLITSIMVITVIAFGISVNHAESKTLKVGYAVNFLSHEWYQGIVRSAVVRAKELGVDLMIADANIDLNKQIKACENFIQQQVDVLLISPVDSTSFGSIVQKAKATGIPIISESNYIEGAVTNIGIDDKKGGFRGGKWMVEYAKNNSISPKILILGYPLFHDCRMRVKGFKEGLKQSGYENSIIKEVDGSAVKETAFTVTYEILKEHPEINMIFGINDDSVLGGIAAYEAMGLDKSKLTAIGVGLEGQAARNALMKNTSCRASVAKFPELVGISLIDAALAVTNGKKLPKLYETPTIIIDKSNFYDFYKKEGDNYVPKLDAIKGLMKH